MSTYPYAPIERLIQQTRRNVGRVNARVAAQRNFLGPIVQSMPTYFARAADSENALGLALVSGLTGQGRALGADIGAKLAETQAPAQAVERFAGGTAATGAAAGQAVGGLSSADVQRLRGFSTAEAVYASALPRLAELMGDQERRALMAQAQEDLFGLSLEAAREAQDAAFRERQFRYQQLQDRAAAKRYAREFAYKKKQDLLAAQAQARRDALAAAAAEREYGLDVAKLGISKGNLDERIRHNKEAEKLAAAQASGKGGGGAKKRADYFYAVREKAFERAQSYAATNNEARPSQRMSRAEARKRLWAEFGKLLVGRGYNKKTVQNMIEAALDAAGIQNL